MGTIIINSPTELAEITEILFGKREFICVNEPTDELVDYTEENIIFL